MKKRILFYEKNGPLQESSNQLTLMALNEDLRVLKPEETYFLLFEGKVFQGKEVSGILSGEVCGYKLVDISMNSCIEEKESREIFEKSLFKEKVLYVAKSKKNQQILLLKCEDLLLDFPLGSGF